MRFSAFWFSHHCHLNHEEFQKCFGGFTRPLRPLSEHFFYAIGGNLYIRHFGVWAGFKGGVHARVMLGWKGEGV